MLETAAASPNFAPSVHRLSDHIPKTVAQRALLDSDTTAAGRRIVEALKLVSDTLPVTRQLLHAGEKVYQAGERFEQLHIVNSGMFKIVNLSADGREQMVGLQFKGDWLGFDGIACGRYGCDVVAMDTGEVWGVRYDTVLRACANQPALMRVLHGAMSGELTRDRDAILSICTLPADARVANFLRNWAESLSLRGLRNDQITLRMTRAEIGNYLGMTLESVSRALSRLAREKVICFTTNGRRDVTIPDVAVLDAFVQSCLSSHPPTMQ
jgi:CRP/FNR family transcriptional regulator